MEPTDPPESARESLPTQATHHQLEGTLAHAAPLPDPRRPLHFLLDSESSRLDTGLGRGDLLQVKLHPLQLGHHLVQHWVLGRIGRVGHESRFAS